MADLAAMTKNLRPSNLRLQGSSVSLMQISLPFALSSTVILFLCFGTAQGQQASPSDIGALTSSNPGAPAFNTQSLNLIGADTKMPAFEETTWGADSPLRRSMFRYGFAFRLNSTHTYTQNSLQAPVANSDQTYVGQREFGSTMFNPILTSDLRFLHLKNAQLHISAGIKYTSWWPAGPNGSALTTMYIYKSLFEDRLEIKAGYIYGNFEFVGMQVGGSVASGAQGVYAVLPNEVGMSYLPLTSPAFNFKWNIPAHMYIKAGLNRSTDAAGGPATIARNSTGLRFIPRGDKLLTIAEGGYNHAATANSLQTWIRGGYMHNSTAYANSLVGGKTSGNFCAYILADHQFLRTDAPAHGLYAGASAMMTPAAMTKNTRYYEARAYLMAPFRSRPADMVSLIATRGS